MVERFRIWKRLSFLPGEWVAGRVALGLAERKVFRGFTLLDTFPSTESVRRLGILAEAIALIEEIDPRRFRRLQDALPQIAISTPDRIEYVFVLRTAFLPLSLITPRAKATIAASLVGLAARARAAKRAGGWRVDAIAKDRLIRLDAQEQLRFLAQFPPGRFTGVDTYREYLHSRAAAST